jgi:hypothetical protein
MPSLEAEQEQLLLEMAEAARSVDRQDQTWTLFDTDDGEALQGPWGTRPVLGRDVLALHEAGLLDNTRMNYVSGYDYVVNRVGFEHADALRARVVAPVDDAQEAVGWEAVEEAEARLRRMMRDAKDVHDFKSVGHQAVTVLEVLARTVFEPGRHLPRGEAEPALNDVGRKLGFVIQSAGGERFEAVRKLMRASYEQAQAVKHRTKPNMTDAGIATDATILLVSMIRRIAFENGD